MALIEIVRREFSGRYHFDIRMHAAAAILTALLAGLALGDWFVRKYAERARRGVPLYRMLKRLAGRDAFHAARTRFARRAHVRAPIAEQVREGLYPPARAFSIILIIFAFLLLSPGNKARAQSGSAPGIPIPAGTWTMALTNGPPAGRNAWEQLVYVSALKQSVMLSIYHQFNSEPNESLLGYSFDTNSWNIIDMGGLFHTENMPEGGESQGYFDYNPNNNTIIYHCCTTGSNQSENAFHTWWYDVLGQSGRDKHTSIKPSFSALQPGGVFDVAHNMFVAHGGDTNVGTWTYDPNGNAWRQMVPSGTPPDPSLILPGMAYSSKEQKIYLFGGLGPTDYNSDLYVYDVPTNTWTLVTPAGGIKPLGRDRFGFAYDSTNNVFLLYGGQNGSVILGDTWIYDPAANTWTQLNPPQSPPIASAAVFAELAYDSDHNAFVLAQPGAGGYFGGDWTGFALQTWLFRYQGGGPNAGAAVSTAQPAPGSVNRNTASWAKDPAIAGSGNALYLAWSETGSPFDRTDSAWPHIYASEYSGGNWIPMGTSFQAISSDSAEAHSPAIAAIGGMPWVSWYASPDIAKAAVYAGAWDGSNWQSGAVGLAGSSHSYQGRSQMDNVAGAAYIALIEVDKSYYPQAAFAYVKAWNGTSWNLVGGGALNRSSGAGTTADSISIADNGSNPYVAWTEYVHTYGGASGDTDTNPQVYASSWNGSAWIPLGGSLNVNPGNWAYDASIAYLGGQPYVAWTERSQTGNAQLYVKTWNGTSWGLVGSGPLNQDSNSGWAFHPSLVADPGSQSLFVAWVEQQALGQKAKVYVSNWTGGSWTAVGGQLNADPINGSAQRVSLTMFNGQPVAAWGEVNAGWMRQIYVKQWNGSAWIQLPGTGGAPDVTPPSSPASLSASTVSPNQINLAWSPSTDTVGVVGYRLFRNGSQIANVTGFLSYQDSTVSPSTNYTYTVAAYDAAGNISGPSPSAGAVTSSAGSSPPTISITTPANGATVGGTVSISANAASSAGISSVQFQLDGANLNTPVTIAGSSYSVSWDTTAVANRAHSISALASDAAGNTASSSISLVVANAAVISAVAAGAITSTGATITWTTNQAADSQAAYGTTSAYGANSALNGALTTSHSVTLSGLAASTTYHYQALSRNAQGILASSGDFTFTTAAPGPTPILQIHADASEVSGVTNGSVVTPGTAPAGFTGTVVVNGGGSVNFAPAQVGNGVYFLSCCANTNNAYYRFAGAMVGNVFNVNQGQVTFYLKSRYSFAQRQASAGAYRYAFDVGDANGHLFNFSTQVSSGYLEFSYMAGGSAQYYYVPQGTEDALYGNGVILKVTLGWDGSVIKLYLNDALVKSTPYTPVTPNWTAASHFDLGAYDYFGAGYDVSDDIIDEFSLTGPAPDTTPPVVAMTAPADGATVTGAVTISANATDNVAVAGVQFQVDGQNVGGVVTGAGPIYSMSWDTTTAVNGTHVLTAIASDAAGNSATANSVSVVVNNPATAPVISAVAAGAITSTGATITWTTDQAADSQVAYGTTSAYGANSALNGALTTSHSVTLSGLTASTTYHYQVLSRNAQGILASSGDFTFTTAAPGPTPILQIHADASEVSGVTNGSVVTPGTAPAGFTGTVVVNGGGSVNFAPAQAGNGVYFLSCCANTNNAYYRFAGAMVGNVFNVNQGQVTFYLKSMYTFAQRKASAGAYRYAFDVGDANGHLFNFSTQAGSGYLEFSYMAGGSAQYYYVPQGTEDALYGNGVILKVTLGWDGSVIKLYLNDALVKSTPYTPVTPNWTAASHFDLGAYDYFGAGYDVSDDIIDEFVVQ